MVKVLPPLVNEIEVVDNAGPVNVPMELAAVALVLRLRVLEPTFTDMALLLDVGGLENVPVFDAAVGALAVNGVVPMVMLELPLMLVELRVPTVPVAVAAAPSKPALQSL